MDQNQSLNVKIQPKIAFFSGFGHCTSRQKRLSSKTMQYLLVYRDMLIILRN